MENSIENIWKEGFLKDSKLIAPQVINLYDRKSIHLVEKMQRLFKGNLWMVIGLGIILFLICLYIGSPVIGVCALSVMLFLALVGFQKMKDNQEIDKALNSYEYMKAFNNWLKSTMAYYVRVYRVVYPLLIILFALGVWYSKWHDKLLQKVLELNPDVWLVYDIPFVLIATTLSLATVMSIFAGTIYRLDVYSLYGGVIRKLEEMLEEMEQLRG